MDKIREFAVLEKKIMNCRLCPRLVAWREEVAKSKRKAYLGWDYWGKPVPGFGDENGKILVVGLAPGAHGSNRTGRMFTGDASGDFLYSVLFRASFANRAKSEFVNDGMALKDLFITAVCRCAPPGNKPDISELDNCQPFLEMEISMIQPRVFVALGRLAFERIIRILSLQPAKMTFGHGLIYSIDHQTSLVCSYHPSRQNTQTGRLTLGMFDQIWTSVRKLL